MNDILAPFKRNSREFKGRGYHTFICNRFIISEFIEDKLVCGTCFRDYDVDYVENKILETSKDCIKARKVENIMVTKYRPPFSYFFFHLGRGFKRLIHVFAIYHTSL